jgi:apolipoprotein N-acyltransferase
MLNKAFKIAVKYEIFLLPLLSAVLFALSLPDISFTPAAFIALVPLFVLMNRLSSFRQCIAASFSWGFFFTIFMGFFLKFAVIDHYEFSWLTFLLFFIFGVVLPNSLIFMFFSGSFYYLKGDEKGGSVFPAIFRVTALPALWILHEYIKETVPFSLPWAGAGYTLSGTSLLIQAADIGGLYFLSFIVAAVNSAAAALIIIFTGTWNLRAALIRPDVRVYMVTLVCIGLFLPLYGIVSVSSVDRAAESAVTDNLMIKAYAVQASHSNKERWDSSAQFMTISDYVGLSAFRKEERSLTVWPETIVTSPGHLNDRFFAALASLLNEGSVLVAGAVRPGRAPGAQHNSAMVIGGDSTLHWYDKVILLPFSETAPLGLGFGSIYDAPSVFTPGTERGPVSSAVGPLSVSICFEVMYPYKQREAVRAGAAYLVNISNDSWFGEHSQPMTHLAGAVMRSVENRRYMVRASNSGYSAVIDPAGRVIISGINKKERIEGSVYPVRGLTLYSRFGDWIIIAAVLIVLVSAYYSGRGGQ